MYLRFITKFKNERDEQETGVFQAMAFLIQSENTFDYDRQRLEEIRQWFNRELDRPKRFNKHGNRHKAPLAISWFKDSASQHLKFMYNLIPILESYDIHVELIKRDYPGYIIFEDDFQVVTLAHGKDKAQVL